jgi:hypothetical protein
MVTTGVVTSTRKRRLEQRKDNEILWPAIEAKNGRWLEHHGAVGSSAFSFSKRRCDASTVFFGKARNYLNDVALADRRRFDQSTVGIKDTQTGQGTIP